MNCLKPLLVSLLLLGLCPRPAHAQSPPDTLSVERMTVRIGETPVEIITRRAGRPGQTYVSLHDDENTAVRAAREVLRQRGGRLVEIRHTGARNVSFVLEGATYTFDPNRIFTDAGAAASLRELGPYSDAALAEVRRFARRLLTAIGIDTLALVVTVHNNTDGRYSAASYAAGGAYENEAAAVHLVPHEDPDDFFFVTTRTLFDALAGGIWYQVVLQDNAGMTDDGSLSVYCGQRGIAYVNVEAQHGHREEQVRMLNYLIEQLKTP